METQNFDQKDFNEIVFENRHKEYGAYVLRKEYENNVFSGFFIAIGSFVLIVFAPLLIQYLLHRNDVNLAQLLDRDMDTKVVEYFEMDKPKVEEVLPEQPKNTGGAPKNEASANFKIDNDSTSAEPAKYDPNANPNNGNNPDPNAKGKEKGEGEVKKTDSLETNANAVFENAEVNPKFKGGDDAFYRFLGDNMKYPDRVREIGKQGTVWVSFIVDRYGKVKNVEVVKGMKNECDAEAVRVINLMPEWIPGTNNGHPVNVHYTIPIKFTLRG